jgi:hypothetical protein
MKTILLIGAVIGLIFGLGFILIPSTALSLYGIDLSQNIVGQFLCRYLGSALLGVSVTWFMFRGAKSQGEMTRGVVVGALVLAVTGLIVAIWDGIAGVASAVVWINTVIYAFLTIGFGYFYFRR